MIILKFVCLLLAIIYGFSNVGKLLKSNYISGVQITLMALGIAGFIFIQFKLY